MSLWPKWCQVNHLRPFVQIDPAALFERRIPPAIGTSTSSPLVEIVRSCLRFVFFESTARHRSPQTLAGTGGETKKADVVSVDLVTSPWGSECSRPGISVATLGFTTASIELCLAWWCDVTPRTIGRRKGVRTLFWGVELG